MTSVLGAAGAAQGAGAWQALAPVMIGLLLALVLAVLLRRRPVWFTRARLRGRGEQGSVAAADGRAAELSRSPVVLGPDDVGQALGERVTFVQLSSDVCGACCETARVLGDVAAQEVGVVHVDLDVAEHPVLVRRLHVLRTPTVLVLDAGGALVARSSGALGPGAAQAALALVPGL